MTIQEVQQQAGVRAKHESGRFYSTDSACFADHVLGVHFNEEHFHGMQVSIAGVELGLADAKSASTSSKIDIINSADGSGRIISGEVKGGTGVINL